MDDGRPAIGKIKAGIEWLEHGRTVADVAGFLVSVGGGSAVKALLEQFAGISPRWATTVWILSSGIFLFLLTRILPKLFQDKTAESSTIQSRKSRLMPLLLVTIVAFILGKYSVASRPTVEQWAKEVKSLENQPVHQRRQNEIIELDGKRFENSSFSGITLVYRGEKPFIFSNNSLALPIVVDVVDGPQAAGAELVMGLIAAKCGSNLAACDLHDLTVTTVDEQLKPITNPF